MTKNQKTILWVAGGVISLGLLTVGIAAVILYFSMNRTFLDRPRHLANKTETIELTYINWACACAPFLETKYYAQDPNYEARDEDCIFIEPADPTKAIPESYENGGYWDYQLKLTGQFYLDKGVPESYVQETSEKPEPARVFRYETFELIPRKIQ
jgi:hypothetical protein